jgi:hypothetical protein
MTAIPLHDDQNLPPEKRKPTAFQQQFLAGAFFSERDRAFHPSMEEEVLIAYFKKYGIAYPAPWSYGKRNINFWVMVYTAAYCSEAGPPPEFGPSPLPGEANRSPTTIRAEIWLYRMQATRKENHQSPISWNKKMGTYSINDKTYFLHPLLKVKRGEPYAHFLPRK